MQCDFSSEELRTLELAMMRWEEQHYRFRGLNAGNKREFTQDAAALKLKLRTYIDEYTRRSIANARLHDTGVST